jgi:hypothetical protein
MHIHAAILNSKSKLQSAKLILQALQSGRRGYTHNMLKTRLINVALVLAILLGLVLILWYILPRLSHLHTPPKINDTATLLVQVQTLSRLVTVKYVLEKVIVLEDPSWLGENWLGESRVLMVAHGIVLAGIDLGELRPEDLQISQNKIIIKLPPARVTDTYLDDKLTQVMERKTGILRAFEKDMEQNARRQAVADLNRAARNGGILKDADERARAQLTNLFQMLHYQVEFRAP